MGFLLGPISAVFEASCNEIRINDYIDYSDEVTVLRGEPISTISKLAGHSSVDTTATFYVNSSREEKTKSSKSMIKKNEKIVVSGDEAIETLKEIEMILISLHDMAAYYMNKDTREYEKETIRFIDEWKVTHKLVYQ